MATPPNHFLIATHLDPTQQTVYLSVVFYEPSNPEHAKPDFLLAQIHFLTDSASYYCELLKKDLVSDLNWSMGLLQRLKSMFGEDTSGLILNFNAASQLLTFSAENQLRAMRFVLFQNQVILLERAPLRQMRQLLAQVHRSKQQTLAALLQTEESQMEKIDKIESLSREATEGYQSEVNYIKDRFLIQINGVKQRLKSKLKPWEWGAGDAVMLGTEVRNREASGIEIERERRVVKGEGEGQKRKQTVEEEFLELF